MKRSVYFIGLSLVLIATACNSGDKNGTSKSENDIDAARNFIRAALDGKFNEAKGFLYNDSSNTQFFDVYQRTYQKTDASIKRDYREATINIHTVTQLNDSTTVVIFSNSYKNDHDTLKVLRKNNQWLVDLKYLFQHNDDSLHVPAPLKMDTIK